MVHVYALKADIERIINHIILLASPWSKIALLQSILSFPGSFDSLIYILIHVITSNDYTSKVCNAKNIRMILRDCNAYSYFDLITKS